MSTIQQPFASIAPTLSVTAETIDPAGATTLLGNLDPQQRPLSRSYVTSLAGDMKAARWYLSPDPITLSNDGALINGQHRLRAVVQSGLAQPFMVSRGWDSEAYQVIGAGRRRGLINRCPQDWLRRSYAIAAVRMAMMGSQVNIIGLRPSDAALVEFADRHEAALTTLFDMAHVSRIRAAVLGVGARALIAGVDPERIRRFVLVAATGVSDSTSEVAAVRLFSMLVQAHATRVAGAASLLHIYARAQTALRVFLEGGNMKTLRGTTGDIWALPPGDEAVEAAAVAA